MCSSDLRFLEGHYDRIAAYSPVLNTQDGDGPALMDEDLERSDVVCATKERTQTAVVADGNGDGSVLLVEVKDGCHALSGKELRVLLHGVAADDGTVLAAGDDSYGQCDVSDWSGITAIAANAYGSFGLRADGQRHGQHRTGVHDMLAVRWIVGFVGGWFLGAGVAQYRCKGQRRCPQGSAPSPDCQHDAGRADFDFLREHPLLVAPCLGRFAGGGGSLFEVLPGVEPDRARHAVAVPLQRQSPLRHQ